MQRTILSKKDLAERWGVDISTLETYEREGYIKRLDLPGAKYSVASIEKLEYDGSDNLLMRKDREIRELREENIELRAKLEKIRGVANG